MKLFLMACMRIDVFLGLHVKFVYFMLSDNYTDIIIMHIEQNFGGVH
jgi:hypothetical protein